MFEPEPWKSVKTSTSLPLCVPARTTEIWWPIPNWFARGMKMARAGSQVAPPFVVRVNGKVSNCGVDHFDLVRENGTWKVMNLTFSSRLTGCPVE